MDQMKQYGHVASLDHVDQAVQGQGCLSNGRGNLGRSSRAAGQGISAGIAKDVQGSSGIAGPQLRPVQKMAFDPAAGEREAPRGAQGPAQVMSRRLSPWHLA